MDVKCNIDTEYIEEALRDIMIITGMFSDSSDFLVTKSAVRDTYRNILSTVYLRGKRHGMGDVIKSLEESGAV